MSGIIFMGTHKLNEIRTFYLEHVGTELWLEQEDCIVLKHGNLLLGFCQREECDTSGIITFFYPTTMEVDDKYEQFTRSGFKGTIEGRPIENGKYRIYHFFARDPEKRRIEFQTFLHPLPGYLDPRELLVSRRSVREFLDREITDQVLTRILESCRFSPTSCNSESYYYILIRERKLLDFLASTRGSSSSPISKGPMAVAICSDPERSRRHIQDGCIAAHQFLIAAWGEGLGTCWIAAMDRDDVKDALGVPHEHYVATITPLGFPAGIPSTPSRRDVPEMIRSIE